MLLDFLASDNMKEQKTKTLNETTELTLQHREELTSQKSAGIRYIIYIYCNYLVTDLFICFVFVNL